MRKIGGGNYARNNPHGKNSVAKYEITPKLTESFESNFIETLSLPKSTRETFILNGPTEDPSIPAEVAYRSYKDTQQTRIMRENLDRINENIMRHWYDLYISDETHQLLLQEFAQKQKRNKTVAEKNILRLTCLAAPEDEFLEEDYLKWGACLKTTLLLKAKGVI